MYEDEHYQILVFGVISDIHILTMSNTLKIKQIIKTEKKEIYHSI